MNNIEFYRNLKPGQWLKYKRKNEHKYYIFIRHLNDGFEVFDINLSSIDYISFNCNYINLSELPDEVDMSGIRALVETLTIAASQ